MFFLKVSIILISSVVFAQSRLISPIVKCNSTYGDYCIFGSYRENHTITLIPLRDGVSCRVNTTNSLSYEFYKREYQVTALKDVEFCSAINQYSVAIVGNVSSYRNIGIDEVSNSEVANKVLALKEGQTTSIKLYQFDDGFFDHFFAVLGDESNEQEYMFNYQNERLSRMLSGCKIDIKGLILSSKYYLIINYEDCEQRQKRTKVFKVERYGFEEVFSFDRFQQTFT